MSLIRCPYCRRIVNNKAAECPRCGYSFNKSNRTTNAQTIEKKTTTPKDEINQQVNYLSLIFNTWLDIGPDLWDFNEECIAPDSIVIGSKSYTPYELNDFAVQCKRKGDYAESIGAYIRIFDSFYKKNHKLPYSSIRGLIKTLICTNNFNLAFVIAATALADAQTRGDVDPLNLSLLQYDFSGLENLAKKVIDNNDTSCVLEYATTFSGSSNYELQKSISEIKEEMSRIRETTRRFTGK